ncbi:hypothetical protein BDY17DRAFT_321367 [Neohortaea acidophila]|uniref:Uncharacterized protein n=1 Tax=Neohortaea acidophila TaxID=245834 RepID=A0A6A6Q247_9PEZI|nr:uncharacterized protein BDY17DRAFT_321367 [Neohortaea acidophila]KAF2486588.1 hypothetical protein BDY17DRAFT_321367 [Neohortaea acidophila]
MEIATSPPLTPLRQYMMSPLDTSPSPTHSYREHLRRRTSSFSSNHDRSPAGGENRRSHRFSGASFYSNGSAVEKSGGLAGTLADELDELDDGEELEYDEEALDGSDGEGGDEIGVAAQEDFASYGARDSGVDVSYLSKEKSSKQTETDEGKEEQCALSPELEDALNGVARMLAASTFEDPIIPRTIALLQDLGNQSSVEAHIQRLTTSTNSLTGHLTAQSKTMQALASATFYSPSTIFSASLDPAIVQETLPLLDALLKDLPIPDPAPLQGMQKLDRETTSLMHALSQLTDSLQMGRQTTNSASRCLRSTQMVVAELRRERERAELARQELNASPYWSERIRARWCDRECKDIVGGFERVCNDLRASLVNGGAAAAA